MRNRFYIEKELKDLTQRIKEYSDKHAALLTEYSEICTKHQQDVIKIRNLEFKYDAYDGQWVYQKKNIRIILCYNTTLGWSYSFYISDALGHQTITSTACYTEFDKLEYALYNRISQFGDVYNELK